MAPNTFGSSTIILNKDVTEDKTDNNNRNNQKVQSSNKQSVQNVQPQNKENGIIWRNVVALALLHMGCLYGMFLFLTEVKIITWIFVTVITIMSGLGVTAGAHRLWTHRSYKATFKLRLILAYLQTMTFQKDIYDWVRDHRVHHKFNDTDADPHNSKRGFFFSHVGWLMMHKHNDVKVKGATVDLSDLLSDPIVVFQRKYYYWIAPFIAFYIPAAIPYYFFNEPFYVAFYALTLTRYTVFLNITWSINSVAHIWGDKPYDKNISATDCVFTALESFGEGWHNYHHIFPWDYKAAELGNYKVNFTTGLIDFFAKIGWAYDLKTVPNHLIQKRIQNTGDGSHPLNDKEEEADQEMLWGWDDRDMSQEIRKEAKITHRCEKVE